jgi:hypothetical protein
MTNAEDLKSGDHFIFRDVEYKCLCTNTDARHTNTIITALRSNNWKDITVIRCFRTAKLQVTKQVKTNLEVLKMEQSEILDEDVAELDAIRAKWLS